MDAKEEIKQKLSVEEVIGDYLELRRAGRNWKGSSPFSNERTPSFMVSPEKQIWHDFSSNKGGDIFSFVMEVEGVDFRGALEILARKANVDLGQFSKGDGQTAKLKKRLLEAHALAAQFYHIHLSKTPSALSYVKEKRGFTPDTIRTWKLGYAPEDGQALTTFLTKRGFSNTDLSKAGLVTQRSGSTRDMFRGRIMIPLADGQGNIVGFTARLLRDDVDAPKYFNTPSTLIYDKGRQVFGLHLAKQQIRKSEYVVIVEGNLDVIASHQAGVTNVVATAGTAMTADHLRSLSRLTLKIRLAFDADTAGQNATERAIPIAQAVGVELEVIQLPTGVKDPDELISQDPTTWQAITEVAQDAPTWILQHYAKSFDKTTAQGKRQLSDKALGVIRGLNDPVEQEHHIKKLAESLDVSVSSLFAKLQQKPATQIHRKPSNIAPVEPDNTAYEDHFLALNILFREVRESLNLVKQAQLHTENRRTVLNWLQQLPPNEIINESILGKLHLDENYVKILLFIAQEQYASWTPAEVMAETMALARRITLKSKKQHQNELTHAIAQAEADGNQEHAAELLVKYQQLLEEEVHGKKRTEDRKDRGTEA